MPRQLSYVVRTEVSKRRYNARFGTVYGGRFTDAVKYLSDKYGIRFKHMTAIAHDLFRYIEMEAMLGERGIFTIPRFGRVERREMQGGVHGKSTVLRFTRSAVRRGGTYVDFHDEEWVDD